MSKTNPIALMTREDGDHKVVAVDSTAKEIKKLENIPIKKRDLMLKYFGYKSPIKSIEDINAAIDYINRNRVNKKSKQKV